MNDPEWFDTDRWWVLRNGLYASGRVTIYTRLYKEDFFDYPKWTLRFTLEDPDNLVQLDPNLTLDEAKEVAMVLSIARSNK